LVITTTNSYCQYNDCCQSRTDKKKLHFPLRTWNKFKWIMPGTVQNPISSLRPV
jgi:hypothetical protein